MHWLIYLSSCVAQSVACLTSDTCLTADPGVASSITISMRFHTFVVIDHEIISPAILLPSADSRRIVVRYYMHEVLFNRLVKLFVWLFLVVPLVCLQSAVCDLWYFLIRLTYFFCPGNKVWLGELTVPT